MFFTQTTTLFTFHIIEQIDALQKGKIGIKINILTSIIKKQKNEIERDPRDLDPIPKKHASKDSEMRKKRRLT